MKIIQQTTTFSRWYKKLRGEVLMIVDARISRMELGNVGDVKPVGQGISEMRIHIAGGIRIYFIERRGNIIILLAGGDKSSQRQDIEHAKRIAKEI